MYYNIEDYPIGSIVYYTEYERYSHRYKVHWGVVEGRYDNGICLRNYMVNQIITIDGKPETEVEIPSKWHKLPKNWSYDTVLADIAIISPKIPSELKINNPEDILKAIEAEYFVPYTYKSMVTTEVDSKQGWRLVHESGSYLDRKSMYISLTPNQAYKTYEEAQTWVDSYYAECKRQAELSDYDWSVEQIDKTLNHYAKLYDTDRVYVNKVKEWLLEQKNVEDIEVRIANGGIEWKYDKNKRWMGVVV